MKKTEEVRKGFKKKVVNPNASDEDKLRAVENYRIKLKKIWEGSDAKKK